jgi:hypothetical protein
MQPTVQKILNENIELVRHFHIVHVQPPAGGQNSPWPSKVNRFLNFFKAIISHKAI